MLHVHHPNHQIGSLRVPHHLQGGSPRRHRILRIPHHPLEPRPHSVHLERNHKTTSAAAAPQQLRLRVCVDGAVLAQSTHHDQVGQI